MQVWSLSGSVRGLLGDIRKGLQFLISVTFQAIQILHTPYSPTGVHVPLSQLNNVAAVVQL